jgi:hypothetical protein
MSAHTHTHAHATHILCSFSYLAEKVLATEVTVGPYFLLIINHITIAIISSRSHCLTVAFCFDQMVLDQDIILIFCFAF